MATNNNKEDVTGSKNPTLDNQDDNEGQGFGNMTPEERRKAGSEGGKAAHRKGTAHEYNSDTGKEAGRKGGSAKNNTEDKKEDRNS
ncbi:MAG: KGG domain-containing protein [bacterium]|nr:KGG domain-containing protein [bacterium]